MITEQNRIDKIRVTATPNKKWRGHYINSSRKWEYVEGETWDQVVEVSKSRWKKNKKSTPEHMWTDASFREMQEPEGGSTAYGATGVLTSEGTLILSAKEGYTNTQEVELAAVVEALNMILRRDKQFRDVVIYTDQILLSGIEQKRARYVHDTHKVVVNLISLIEDKHDCDVKIQFRQGHGKKSPAGLSLVDVVTRKTTRAVFDDDHKENYGYSIFGEIRKYEKSTGSHIHSLVIQGEVVTRADIFSYMWENDF